MRGKGGGEKKERKGKVRRSAGGRKRKEGKKMEKKDGNKGVKGFLECEEKGRGEKEETDI